MLKKTIIFVFIFTSSLLANKALAQLSCQVATTCNSPDVIVLKMSSISNSHAELPTENNYPQLLCCGNIAGLSNSCSNNSGVVLRLSSATNAHVEENTQSTPVYNGHNACLSVPSGSVSIGYQNNNCDNLGTTIASISQSPTNAHIGDATAYSRKVCAFITVNLCSSIYCGQSALAYNITRNTTTIDANTKREILKIADFNFDEEVNILDLSILLYYINQPYQEYSNTGFSFYDLNKDHKIDFLDVSILFYYWDLVF